MCATTISVSEQEGLKARLRAAWMSGDFDKIAQVLLAGGAEFIARLICRYSRHFASSFTETGLSLLMRFISHSTCAFLRKRFNRDHGAGSVHHRLL